MKTSVFYFEFSKGPNEKGNICSGNVRRQAITWTYVDPVHWRIYVALGKGELKQSYICLSKS